MLHWIFKGGQFWQHQKKYKKNLTLNPSFLKRSSPHVFWFSSSVGSTIFFTSQATAALLFLPAPSTTLLLLALSANHRSSLLSLPTLFPSPSHFLLPQPTDPTPPSHRHFSCIIKDHSRRSLPPAGISFLSCRTASSSSSETHDQ